MSNIFNVENAAKQLIWTRVHTLQTMGRIESRLADLLGTRVDLSSPEWLKESVKNQVLREAVLAF